MKSQAPKSQPVILSGIAPSGNLHIGNYLGALKQWVELQKTHRVFAMVADLHAITTPQDPEELRKKTREVAALMIACGIDPEQSVVFIQSHVPAHAQLAWILNTITPLGELERMTQFKDKAKNAETVAAFTEIADSRDENEFAERFEMGSYTKKIGLAVNAGLLNYPTLMAADILLYKATHVPVGEDQLQHLELTRTLARKFNNRFGEVFVEPQPFIIKDTARIMGLDDPAKKMSKSAPNPTNYIGLLDSPDIIRKKIKSAVTDSGADIRYNEKEKPAISNLMRIHAAFSGQTITDIESRYRGKGYADFKRELGELLVEKLAPVRDHYAKLSKDKKTLDGILTSGAARANETALKTFEQVKTLVGLL